MLNALKKVVVLGCFLFFSFFLWTRSSSLSSFLHLFLILFLSSLFLEVFPKSSVWQRTMVGMCAPLHWALGKQNCLLSSWSMTALVLNWFSLAIGLPLCSSTFSARELSNDTYLSLHSFHLWIMPAEGGWYLKWVGGGLFSTVSLVRLVASCTVNISNECCVLGQRSRI